MFDFNSTLLTSCHTMGSTMGDHALLRWRVVVTIDSDFTPLYFALFSLVYAINLPYAISRTMQELNKKGYNEIKKKKSRLPRVVSNIYLSRSKPHRSGEFREAGCQLMRRTRSRSKFDQQDRDRWVFFLSIVDLPWIYVIYFDFLALLRS